MSFEPYRNQEYDELIHGMLVDILEGIAVVLEAHAGFLDYLRATGRG